MSMNKYQGVKTTRSLDVQGYTIPKGARGVFAGEGNKGALMIWLKLNDRFWFMTIPSDQMTETFAEIETNRTIHHLSFKLKEHEEMFATRLSRTCRPGDIVKVVQRIRLSDGANLVKGQYLHCTKGGESPTFEFFHPLKYVKQTATWQHVDVEHAIELCGKGASPCEIQFLERTGGNLTWSFDVYRDIDAYALKIFWKGKGVTLIKREGEEVTYKPGDQGSRNAIDVAQSLKDALSLKDTSMLGIHLRRVSDDYLILSFAEYLKTGAYRLMSYAEYLWMAGRAAEAEVMAEKRGLAKEAA